MTAESFRSHSWTPDLCLVRFLNLEMPGTGPELLVDWSSEPRGRAPLMRAMRGPGNCLSADQPCRTGMYDALADASPIAHRVKPGNGRLHLRINFHGPIVPFDRGSKYQIVRCDHARVDRAQARQKVRN